jgi:hypothetical protein
VNKAGHLTDVRGFHYYGEAGYRRRCQAYSTFYRKSRQDLFLPQKEEKMKEKAKKAIPELVGDDNRGEIVLYQPEGEVRLEVRVENETVWLNRQQLAVLFNRDVKTIGKHIANALNEELKNLATVANFATVQKEGSRSVSRMVEHYNLDMILSIGYRVKSANGVKFRRWANQVLKDFMLKGYAVNQRKIATDLQVADRLHERS